MDYFDCGGWLKVTGDDSSSYATVELDHPVNHEHYLPLEIPATFREMIEKRTKAGDNPTQV